MELQENLRQLCVYRLANETGKPEQWWDYITRFGAECAMKDKNYNAKCAEKVPPHHSPLSPPPLCQSVNASLFTGNSSAVCPKVQPARLPKLAACCCDFSVA